MTQSREKARLVRRLRKDSQMRELVDDTALLALRLANELDTTNEATLVEYGLNSVELRPIAERYRRFGIWKGEELKAWGEDWELETFANVGRGYIEPSWCDELDVFAFRFVSTEMAEKWYELRGTSLAKIHNKATTDSRFISEDEPGDLLTRFPLIGNVLMRLIRINGRRMSDFPPDEW